MELTNVKHYDGNIEEILIADCKEANEVIAQLTISKDNVNVESPVFNFENPESLRQALISKKGPYPQMITITSYTAKDPYTESSLSLKKDHSQILSQVSNFLTIITGVTPAYTKDSENEEVETIENYSAKLLTEVNVISTIINYLKANNIEIDEVVPIIEEEPLIKEEAMRRI